MNKEFTKRILVTGGSGFIGTNLLLKLVPKYPNYLFINLDALTYAGNRANLSDVESASNYLFEHGDITDLNTVQNIFEKYGVSHVINFAAESHVDRSISNPIRFVQTNVMGTLNLLIAARETWGDDIDEKRFYHISTDEVYGSLKATEPAFNEQNRYAPRSPYAASKASADHFVRAYYETYKLPILISSCSNNYGPYQFPEKLIPLTINNILHEKKIPIYGDGKQIRDWLYVEDHVDAIDRILHEGHIGETYNIGGSNELSNLELVKIIISLVDAAIGREKGYSTDLISFVKDRPGHDTRYAINANKLKNNLDWAPKYLLSDGLRKTVEWYIENQVWLEHSTGTDYQDYYTTMYANR